MKAILIAACLLCSQLLISQESDKFYFEYKIRYMEFVPIKYTPNDDVREIIFDVVKKKKVSKHRKIFNDKGLLTEYSIKNKEGKFEPRGEFEYDEHNEISKALLYNKRGILYAKNAYKRNSEGKPVSSIHLNRKGNKWFEDAWTYSEKGCLSEYRTHFRGRLNGIWTHEYYDDNCQLKKTVMTNGKGKVKQTWTYDCKNEGEVLQKKKDVTQVCKWEEMSGNILVKVYQTFDEKGKVVKNVSKYTSNDTLLLESARYDEKDRLLFKCTYDKSMDRPLVYTNYKKGKQRYQFIYSYQNDLIVSRSSSKRGKIYSRAQYSYENGNLDTYEVFTKKEKPYKSVNLTYVLAE